MLVGRGVEDGRGTLGAEEMPNPLGVADVGHQRHAIDLGKTAGELAVDLEERVLHPLDKQQSLRFETADLAAHLRTDGAPGAGDEHDFVAEIVADRLGVESDGIAAEQVFDVHRLDLADLDSSRDQIADRRDGAKTQIQPLLSAPIDEFADILLRRLRHREEHLLNIVLLGKSRESLGSTEHVNAADARPVLTRVVVQEADHLVPDGVVTDDLAQDGVAHVAGTHDEKSRTGRVGRVVDLLVVEAVTDPGRRDEDHGKKPIQEEHAIRHPLVRRWTQELLDPLEDRDVRGDQAVPGDQDVIPKVGHRDAQERTDVGGGGNPEHVTQTNVTP